MSPQYLFEGLCEAHVVLASFPGLLFGPGNEANGCQHLTIEYTYVEHMWYQHHTVV